MGLFSAGRGPRSYDYRPRHYDPDEDEDHRMKRRMKARRSRQSRRSPLSLLFFLALLLITILLYQAL